MDTEQVLIDWCTAALTNAAVADPRVPDVSMGQHPWQRFTHRHYSAIHVMGKANVLVANNRLAPSSDSFVMPGYLVHRNRRQEGDSLAVQYDVVFDYDNRPGITVNDHCIGAAGGEHPSGTAQSHLGDFARGS